MEWNLLLLFTVFIVFVDNYRYTYAEDKKPTQRADIEVTATARIIVTDAAEHIKLKRHGYKPTKPSSVKRRHRKFHSRKFRHRRTSKTSKKRKLDYPGVKRGLPFTNPQPGDEIPKHNPGYSMFIKSSAKKTRSTDGQSHTEDVNFLSDSNDSLGGGGNDNDEENDEDDGLSPTGAPTDEPNQRTDSPANEFNEFNEPKDQLDESNSSLQDSEEDDNESEDNADTTPTDNPTPELDGENSDLKRTMHQLFYNGGMSNENTLNYMDSKMNDNSVRR